MTAYLTQIECKKTSPMLTPKPVEKIDSGKPALRLAVLILADNAQAAVSEKLLAEVAR